MRSSFGFFVPPIRVTSRPAGWVHQSVTPTRAPGSVTATASVRDGTRETTRAPAGGRAQPAMTRSSGDRLA